MRAIHLLIVHCSASDVPAHDNVETIRKWHTLPPIPKDVLDKIRKGVLPKSEAFKFGRGWRDVGYHWIITKDGVVHPGRPESVVGAHCRGHNQNSIGICLTGDQVFSPQQLESLSKLLKELCAKYSLDKSDILAHHDLEKWKTCPNFDLHSFLAKLNFTHKGSDSGVNEDKKGEKKRVKEASVDG